MVTPCKIGHLLQFSVQVFCKCSSNVYVCSLFFFFLVNKLLRYLRTIIGWWWKVWLWACSCHTSESWTKFETCLGPATYTGQYRRVDHNREQCRVEWSHLQVNHDHTYHLNSVDCHTKGETLETNQQPEVETGTPYRRDQDWKCC